MATSTSRASSPRSSASLVVGPRIPERGDPGRPRLVLPQDSLDRVRRDVGGGRISGSPGSAGCRSGRVACSDDLLRQSLDERVEVAESLGVDDPRRRSPRRAWCAARGSARRPARRATVPARCGPSHRTSAPEARCRSRGLAPAEAASGVSGSTSSQADTSSITASSAPSIPVSPLSRPSATSRSSSAYSEAAATARRRPKMNLRSLRRRQQRRRLAEQLAVRRVQPDREAGVRLAVRCRALVLTPGTSRPHPGPLRRPPARRAPVRAVW